MKTTFTLLILPLLLGTAAAQNQGVPDSLPLSGGAELQTMPRTFSKPFITPDGVDTDKLKDAAQTAATDVWKNYVSSVSDTKVKSFAVLPLQKDIDGDYVALQLRNKFTEICGPQGLQLYTRMDQEWNTLLKEIAWGENFGDTMDQATIQKFGRIKGVQALVFSRITGASITDRGGVKLRLNVQVFEVETGEQLWGREIVSVQEGTMVQVIDAQVVRDYRQWFIGGGAVLGALVLLFVLLKMVAKASRPR
jgi:hypothetical protein